MIIDYDFFSLSCCFVRPVVARIQFDLYTIFLSFKRTDLNIDIIILIHSWNYNIFFRLKACFVFKMLSQNIFLIWYLYMSLVSTARRDLLSHVVSYWPANELNVEKTINVKYYIRRLDNKGMLLLQYGHSDLSFMLSFIHLYF